MKVKLLLSSEFCLWSNIRLRDMFSQNYWESIQSADSIVALLHFRNAGLTCSFRKEEIAVI